MSFEAGGRQWEIVRGAGSLMPDQERITVFMELWDVTNRPGKELCFWASRLEGGSKVLTIERYREEIPQDVVDHFMAAAESWLNAVNNNDLP